METLHLTKEDAMLGLRLMKTIAMADGSAIDPREVVLIEAAASALGHAVRAEDLLAIEPQEIADALVMREPVIRERALQAAMITSMIDGTVNDAELALLNAFASALDVVEPRLKNLEQLAHGHLRLMWLDLARRSFAKPIFEEALKKRGLSGVLKIVAPMVGLGKDPDLTRRYNDLGKLADDTLGRAYWQFIVSNDLGFPGEGIVAEEGVWHDISHVLAGYGTDAEGEVQVVSFISGYRREDPFFWLFTIALQFHLGIKVSPYSPKGIGHFDPALVVRAVERGMAMTRDLSVNYDPWTDMTEKLKDVRRKYGVPPP